MNTYIKTIAIACTAAALVGCRTQVRQESPAERLATRYVDGIEFGMSVAEARKLFPNLEWRPYWGWSAEFEQSNSGYHSFGVQNADSPSDSAGSAEIEVIHLFSRDTSILPPDFSDRPEIESQEGCGGLRQRIRVLYWTSRRSGIVWTRNPDAENGSPAVHLVLTRRAPEPQRHVSDFSPQPCSQSQ